MQKRQKSAGFSEVLRRGINKQQYTVLILGEVPSTTKEEMDKNQCKC